MIFLSKYDLLTTIKMKIQITNKSSNLVIHVNYNVKSNNSFDKPKEMMYCHKFLYRIPYNNFSGKRGEGCALGGD